MLMPPYFQWSHFVTTPLSVFVFARPLAHPIAFMHIYPLPVAHSRPNRAYTRPFKEPHVGEGCVAHPSSDDREVRDEVIAIAIGIGVGIYSK